jgi:hypothetical protein
MFGPSERNWQRTISSKVAHVWKPRKDVYDSFCGHVRDRELLLLINANDSPKCKTCLKVLSCLFR